MSRGRPGGPALLVGLVLWTTVWALVSAASVATTRAQGAGGAARPRAAQSADGAELFATTCQVCHGLAGIGGVGPALRGAKFTTDFVRKALAEGRPGTMMPQFTATFSPAEIAEVTRYVVSLQTPAGPAPGGLRGDARAGESVFFMRGSARSCSVCHSIEGRGGNVGPELMPKIAPLTPKQLFQKIIVVPHRSSDPTYNTVQLTTRTGTVYTGIRSGETRDAVLFYDTATLPPVLRTIPKADITASAARQGSVMPSDYAARLTLQQLLDVVAFLKSVSGDRAATVTLADVVD
jgi:putative heme-binding domain-containing protein